MDTIFSPCRTWRYTLERGVFVGWPNSRVAFIGLNPSTADEKVNDPTVRRCIGYATDWMFPRMVMLNIFAYRSTDPKVLRSLILEDAIGPDNDEHLLREALASTLVVCCWGVHGELGQRGKKVLGMLAEAGVKPHALAVTKAGHPKHPLYLRADLEPVPYDGA